MTLIDVVATSVALIFFFFFQAEDGIRDYKVTGVQTCALPIYTSPGAVDSVSVYAARVAALDKIQDATERALQAAPHDPVINQYYLATMGEIGRASCRERV